MTRLDCIKKALEINAAAYENVKKNIRDGISERELYEIVRDTVEKMTVGVDHEFKGDFVGGKNAGNIDGGPYDNVLKAGDCFILDLSVRYEMAWSDTCRTFFVGDITDEQKRAYETVLQLQKIGENTIKDRLRGCEVKKAMEEYLSKTEFADMMPHHGGHALGERAYMKPSFDPDCIMTICKGEVLTLEPGLYRANEWGIRVENDYLLTDNGLECIFNYPRELEYFIIK